MPSAATPTIRFWRISAGPPQIIFAFTWLFYSAVRFIQIDHLNSEMTLWKIYVFLADYLMSGILIPIISVSIFLFLSSFNFSNSAVNKIASTTFGVYLLHDSNLGRELIWNNILCPEKSQFNLVWYKYILLSLSSVIGIFTVCALIDMVRQVVFEKWMEKKTQSGIVKKCAVGEYPKSWIGRSQAA